MKKQSTCDGRISLKPQCHGERGHGERGVGGPGLRRGGLLVFFLQIGEGQTCFIRNRGRVTVFFDKEKITPCRLVDSY